LSITSAEDGNDAFATFSTADSRTAETTLTTPAAPEPISALVSVVSDIVAAVLNPFLGTGDGSPIQLPILTAMLAAVRDGLERMFVPRSVNRVSQPTVSLVADTSPQPLLVDPTDQHVLVIGVDGTNLSRILDDPLGTPNFHALMSESTNSAPSIVGHTTISNPSWTAILTGEWGEKTGVINNVFTPWTYDKFPTVFNQLETLDSNIDTMAIADWNVISGIAGAGSAPVDDNVFIAQIEGDTLWAETDDAVGDATVDAIEAADPPNFLFSYFVGVDENGHMFGGASPEYKAAIQNVDENLGEILQAIETSGEEWTIIMVTDHGHQPQKGFGHGFQSPDETATFVIANGPDFKEGFINTDYEIVDTTPTVVALFGGTPKPGSDGVTLMSLSGSDQDPADLTVALREQLADNHEPDVITNVALSLRTVFATVPYYVYGLRDSLVGVPGGEILFSGLYIATNVPAQIVALLTGVTGAGIVPLLPPPPPDVSPTEEADSVLLVCAVPGSTASSCGDASAA
jgi:hypothetical protein